MDAGPGVDEGQSTPESEGVTLETVANHVDHICQIAGNARHVGIGSDLDGAFGTEQCPADEHDCVISPRRLEASARGYAPEDIENIAHGNPCGSCSMRGGPLADPLPHPLPSLWTD
jgi:membrane dipeptidase